MRAALRPLGVITVSALLLSACSSDRLPWQATPTPTATVTASPTPTPTPTPTAPPLELVDNVGNVPTSVPVASAGAPCGIVDSLDFPMNPPDGDGALARWGYGRYSNRRGLYHAGEDWLLEGGRALGHPVHAVGHGIVTYAQPWGWGGDKGVVIVRHRFEDGRTELSFYGHLDPPSVTLAPGQCVVRGQQVGVVGNPRTRPHLHFEIRSHLPDTPGPGYWASDPTQAGWEPPSEYIWTQRVRAAPATIWTRPAADARLQLVGAVADGSVVIVQDGAVIALDPASGDEAWRLPGEGAEGVADAGLASVAHSAHRLYVVRGDNVIEAYDVASDGSGPGLSWRQPANARAIRWVAPLASGGVAVHGDRRLMGYDADGQRRWTVDDVVAPGPWLHAGDALVVATGGREPKVVAIDGSGAVRSIRSGEARPVAAASPLWLYAPDGVYRAGSDGVRRLLPLAPGIVWSGDAIGLGDGGLLVSHRETTDTRLVRLDGSGDVSWTRSTLGETTSPQPVLLELVGDTPFAITGDGDVWSVDAETGRADKVFESGGGGRRPGHAQALPVGSDRMLLDFGGKEIVMLDLAASDS